MKQNEGHQPLPFGENYAQLLAYRAHLVEMRDAFGLPCINEKILAVDEHLAFHESLAPAPCPPRDY